MSAHHAVGAVLLAAGLVCVLPMAAPCEPLGIVLPGGSIQPGERVQLKAVPVGNPAEPERWVLLSGLGSLGPTGHFKAPYIVPVGGATATVRVSRGPKGYEVSADATLRLAGGSFPGADSCAGIRQSHLPEPGEYVQADELPEALKTVQAVYPTSARARKIQGGLVVNVLVCRDGSVIDAYPSWGEGTVPESVLEEAALDAARQWVFKPATVAGSPVAAWVAIPFSFRL